MKFFNFGKKDSEQHSTDQAYPNITVFKKLHNAESLRQTLPALHQYLETVSIDKVRELSNAISKADAGEELFKAFNTELFKESGVLINIPSFDIGLLYSVLFLEYYQARISAYLYTVSRDTGNIIKQSADISQSGIAHPVMFAKEIERAVHLYKGDVQKVMKHMADVQAKDSIEPVFRVIDTYLALRKSN